MSEAFFEALSIALRLKSDMRTDWVYLGKQTVPGALFASMAFNQGSINRVGKGEFRKVFGNIVFHLIGLEAS